MRGEDKQTERLTCKAAAQLEMILQASEYEAAQGLKLQEFFDSTAGRFKTETGKAWAAEIVSRRTARIAEQTQNAALIAASRDLVLDYRLSVVPPWKLPHAC